MPPSEINWLSLSLLHDKYRSNVHPRYFVKNQGMPPLTSHFRRCIRNTAAVFGIQPLRSEYSRCIRNADTIVRQCAPVPPAQNVSAARGRSARRSEPTYIYIGRPWAHRSARSSPSTTQFIGKARTKSSKTRRSGSGFTPTYLLRAYRPVGNIARPRQTPIGSNH